MSKRWDWCRPQRRRKNQYDTLNFCVRKLEGKWRQVHHTSDLFSCQVSLGSNRGAQHWGESPSWRSTSASRTWTGWARLRRSAPRRECQPANACTVDRYPSDLAWWSRWGSWARTSAARTIRSSASSSRKNLFSFQCTFLFHIKRVRIVTSFYRIAIEASPFFILFGRRFNFSTCWSFMHTFKMFWARSTSCTGSQSVAFYPFLSIAYFLYKVSYFIWTCLLNAFQFVKHADARSKCFSHVGNLHGTSHRILLFLFLFKCMFIFSFLVLTFFRLRCLNLFSVFVCFKRFLRRRRIQKRLKRFWLRVHNVCDRHD